MIYQFDKKITEKHPEMFEYIESRNIWSLIVFTIDTKARKSIVVKDWLNDIIKNPSKELIKICDEIPNNKNPDYIMTDILRWVNKNIKYKSDSVIWKMSDKWQTPEETLNLKTCDCEDGAILMYAMAIYKNIPVNRLLLFCGSVVGGGHCWLGYKSTEYPLNWCFMDWCYWYDSLTPNSRTKYYIDNQTIYDDPTNNYKNIWFGFNHIKSYLGIKNVNEYR